MLATMALSCAPASGVTGSNGVILRQQAPLATFYSDWLVLSPNTTGATIRVEDGAIAITMPTSGRDDMVVRRRFDVLAARGQRLRLKARVRTEAPVGSFARATLTTITTAAAPSYRDIGSTSTVNSSSGATIHAVIDISPTATAGELDLVLHGPGTAWFSDVEVVAIGASPSPAAIPLSPQQIANLVTFSRAAALIRYLHPSDQAAGLDWNAFLPMAIRGVLQVTSSSDLLSELRATFSELSPTVTFSNTGSPAAPVIPPRSDGTHLVRWRRTGLGTSPFYAFREGRDQDSTVATALTRLDFGDLRGCKELSLQATGCKLPGTGHASLLVRILGPGVRKQDITESFPASRGEIAVKATLPVDVQAVEVGVRAGGSGGAVVNALAASCDGGPQRTVDIANAKWTYLDFDNLYTWQVAVCGTAPCATLRRSALDTEFDPVRDVLHRDIGNGIMMHLPLAVWSGATGTIPATTALPAVGDFAVDDVESRLAAVSAAWGTLWIFFPYFADQNTDWVAALPDALREAAAAHSPHETHVALLHLIAYLRDNHANVTHPAAPMTGGLPITLRRFGSRLIVTGGVPEYVKTIGVGSELEMIDGIGAVHAYEQAVTQISPATEGLREYLAPIRMGMGVPGTLRRLRTRGLDGHASEHVLPLVPRDSFAHTNREVRPPNGAELVPGVFYLDLDTLSGESWSKLLPALEHAHAIVLDFRGYVTPEALDLMSHITSKELRSPIWETPIVPYLDDHKYSTGHWDVRPQSPKLDAKIVGLVDARAMSAVETVLQMFSENKLGILVGETSGGTNGNVTYAELPGGFRVRFTGMRASSDTGWTVQGHGFKPDYVVHPTVEGIRSGRDEILEAGIAAAKRLVTP